MSEWKGKSQSFLWGTLTGGIVGVIAGLLFAPKSGRELRQDLQEQCREIGDKTQEMFALVSEKTKGAAEVVSAQTEEWLGKMQSLAHRATQEVRGRKESVSTQDSGQSGEEHPTTTINGFRAE